MIHLQSLSISMLFLSLVQPPQEIVIKSPWWNPGYTHRLLLDIYVLNFDCENKLMEVLLESNETKPGMSALGINPGGREAIPPSPLTRENSIWEAKWKTLVEVDESGKVVREDIPLQWISRSGMGVEWKTIAYYIDESGNIKKGNADSFKIDPTREPALDAPPFANLFFRLPGKTTPPKHRWFYLYWSEKEPKHKPISPEPLVTLEDPSFDEGQESYKITTQNATYYYHKQGAGFSSMEDRDGNDWLGYKPGGGPAGEYRGIPNTGYPEGYNHPGKTLSQSRILCQGPLMVSILSESLDKKWACQWDVFPEYARMTLFRASHPFWFLYEGTPGGKLDEDIDYIVRPDGRKTLCNEKWDEDIQALGEQVEWLYFGDGKRHLYLINENGDHYMDSYWPMQGEMTVFGFGRKDLNQYMDYLPARFLIGFSEAQSFEEMRDAIRAAYTPALIKYRPMETLDTHKNINEKIQ